MQQYKNPQFTGNVLYWQNLRYYKKLEYWIKMISSEWVYFFFETEILFKELFHAPQFPLHTAALYGSIGCIKILEKLGKWTHICI